MWKAQRTATLEILRELGLGKNVLALKVQEEVEKYVEFLADKEGQPFDLSRLTQTSVSNNICSIIFGKRYLFNFVDAVIHGSSSFSSHHLCS